MRTILICLFFLPYSHSFAGEIKPKRIKHEKDSSIFRFNKSFYFGGGTTIFLGEFDQYHNSTQPFVFGIQFATYKFSVNWNAHTGNSQPKKAISTPSYSIPIDTLNYFLMHEIGIGYEVLRTRNWQITPQFGVSTFQMGWTNQQIDKNDSPIVPNILLANDVIYRFKTFKLKTGGAVGFDLRYRLSWAPFKFDKDLRGKFLNNQLSIGFFGY